MVMTAAALWGFIGVFVRILSEAGLDTMQINGARSIVCTVLLFIALMIYDRKILNIRSRDIWLFVFPALMKLIMDICYVQAQLQLSLSLAAVLISTDCYFTLIVSYFIFRKDITIWKIIAAIIGFLGCSVLVGIFTEDLGNIDFIGVLIGLGAAVAGTFYAVGLKITMNKGYGPITTLFYVFLFGSVMMLPIMNLPGTVQILSDDVRIIGFLVVVVLFFTMTPYCLYSKGLKELDPSTVNILLFVDIAASAVAGLLFYNETLDLVDILGFAMILLSLFLVNKGSSKNKEVEVPEGPR